MACFMGLASFLASRPEVLRVAPRYAQRLLNASARAIINSATATDTPLTDAGLDGTGQVIQVRWDYERFSSAFRMNGSLFGSRSVPLLLPHRAGMLDRTTAMVLGVVWHTRALSRFM